MALTVRGTSWLRGVWSARLLRHQLFWYSRHSSAKTGFPDVKALSEELGDLEDWIDQGGSTTKGEIESEKNRERRRILFHIMRRKYFKPEQESSLLTWDAKEQIRYLHAEEPEVWTPERIAQSFPISVEGVKRFLQNNYMPQSLDDVVKHDRRVRKRWLALQAGDGSAGGPLKLRYEEMMQTGLVQHAGGNVALPMPARSQLLEMFTPPWRQPGRQPGLFESIVKSYADKKLEIGRAREALEGHQQWEKIRGENQLLLEDLAKSSQQVREGSERMESVPQQSKPEQTDADKTPQEFSSVDKSGFSYTDPVLGEQSMHPISIDETMIQPEGLSEPVRRRRRGVRQRRQINHSDPLEELQMKGTQKIASKHQDSATMVSGTTYDTSDLQARKQRQVLEKLRYATPRQSDESVKEAYIYEAGSGYQHPFGRVQAEVEDIPASANVKDPRVVTRKGKAHYDADGEFLYKIP